MTVRRRIVWYFHGFDPATTGRYRRIFEAASARLSVLTEDLPSGGDGWRARRGGVVTDIRYLRYEELVRAWRAPPLGRRLVRGAGAFAGYWRDGAMARLARRAPRVPALAAAPFVGSATPVGLAAFAFTAGPVAGSAAVVAALVFAAWLLRWSYLDIVADLFAWMRALARDEAQSEAYLGRIREAAARIADEREEADEVLVVGHSLGGIAALLALAEVLEASSSATSARCVPPPFLTRGEGAGGGPAGVVVPGAFGDGPEPDSRQRVPQPRPSGTRGDGEVAAFGSAGLASVGDVAARDAGCAGLTLASERPGEGVDVGRGVRLSLLTLGSTHGVVLAQRGPGRDRLASAIARVAAAGVSWVDVSSPRDAFCMPLTDPLLLIGDVARPGMVSPRVLSARLRNAPRIPGDRRMLFGAMRRHMGYLLASEPGSGFDYAETVTGAQTLRERFGARRNSPRARMWQP